mmetsp:Transcript_14663/g.30832  ORF Transcript_14663/g.30832 Transcript_14663/m.30832 type:complete len:95 (-) Transcript_14663:1604-1888(-)
MNPVSHHRECKYLRNGDVVAGTPIMSDKATHASLTAAAPVSAHTLLISFPLSRSASSFSLSGQFFSVWCLLKPRIIKAITAKKLNVEMSTVFRI